MYFIRFLIFLGVTRYVGDVISDRVIKLKNKVVVIGIVLWGIVENKEELIGKDVNDVLFFC